MNHKIKKDKDPNQRHYFTTVPSNEVEGIFKLVASKNAEIHLWKKGQSENDIENFEIFDFKPGLKKLLIRKKGTIIQKLVPSTLLNQVVFFKIPYEKSNFMSTSTLIKDVESKEYYLSIAGEVFQSQQRTNYRLQAGQHISVQVKIDKSVFEALDISAGGTSIIVPSSDSERFKKDLIFADCTLRFNKKNYEVPKILIAGVWEQKDKDGDVLPQIRLGLQFMNMQKEVEEALVQHVNSEARGEEIRKKFALK